MLRLSTRRLGASGRYGDRDGENERERVRMGTSEREADRCIEAPSGQAGKAQLSLRAQSSAPVLFTPAPVYMACSGGARRGWLPSGEGTWWRAVAHRPPGRAQRVAGGGAPRECSNDDGGGGGA